MGGRRPRVRPVHRVAPRPGALRERFAQVWSLGRVGTRLYAGTKPAVLLSSDDDGATWSLVEGLTEHPSAADWVPGAAGLVLHTIIADPPTRRSCGSASPRPGSSPAPTGRDLGAAQRPRCAGVGHRGRPSGWPAGGPDRALRPPHRPRPGPADVLYQQNHHGVWRSDDGGRGWHDVTSGLPSTFGFGIRVHPRDAQTIWTVPLNGDMAGRYPPDAAAAVWCSRDGGANWQAERDGLPQQSCFFTVLRQGMAGDGLDPAGVYFGTNTGSVFASRDEGRTWTEVARHLPPFSRSRR